MNPTNKMTDFFKKRGASSSQAPAEDDGKRTKKALSFRLENIADGNVVMICEKSFWTRWNGAAASAPSGTGLACFDLDFTLVATKSKKKSTADGNDWQMWSPEVIPWLQVLDVPLVVFSNQEGLSWKGGNKDALQRTLLD
mmetsp:Transcript_44869/g.87852  ORF Transcript_44869/g.87852 Transcript_44869/m.87852 type:complete len:140 (-) Transcript_44869:188-607(-)